MKKLLFYGFVLMNLSAIGQNAKHVLFLGNSYTSYFNLPQLTRTLALSAGDTLTFDSYGSGDYTFQDHFNDTTTHQKIAQGNWDFVVLQEQSQLPAMPIAQVQTESFVYATKLDSLITAANSCTETMFYMTWGRENGDVVNCPTWPPVCTYQGMDSLLHLRYKQMALDNHGVLSPVGAVWNYIRVHNPSIQLYGLDGSQPSIAGSYAAACVFYTTIFRKDPTLITLNYGLPASDALAIRNAAKAVVYDSLLTWHVGEYDPVASFTLVTGVYVVAFTNTSVNADNYLWDFGDGTTSTSTLLNPLHVYSCNPNFGVTLLAERCNVQSFFTVPDVGFNAWSNLDPCYSFADLNDISEVTLFQISPNPTSNFVQLQINRIDKLNLIDALGKEHKLVYTKKGDGFEIDLSPLEAGMYWIKIESDGQLFGAKVLKE